MSAVPTVARHLLGEVVLEEISPSALDRWSRGDGRCSPTSFLLTPPGRSVHGQGIFFCWIMVFFTGVFLLLLSPRKLQSIGKSRDGDFYARLIHCQIFNVN